MSGILAVFSWVVFSTALKFILLFSDSHDFLLPPKVTSYDAFFCLTTILKHFAASPFI